MTPLKKIYHQKYYTENRAVRLMYQKEYRAKNHLKIKESKRLYRIKNKNTKSLITTQHTSNYSKIHYALYYKKNKERISQKFKYRRKTDIQFRIRKNLSSRLSTVLKRIGSKKKVSTLRYLNCSIEELKHHIEQLFVNGMTWENYGKWHIDHIKPLSKFDLTKEENVYKAMETKNLQPLWAEDNLRKGNRI